MRSHRIPLGGRIMQAAVVPAVSSSWQVKDVPQPQPGPNQVLVKMHASGICYTDVHQTLGHLPGPFPRILGHEPVGEIIAAAADVTTRKVGDRVGTAWIQSTCGRCEWCQRGRKMFCPYLKGTGIEAQGGHAEYMLMNADATYLIPDKVSYEQAAPIFCAGYTVYSGLRWADPKPHERVAVLGIGGLGHLAVQYAKAAGFETIAVSHSPDKDKMIRDLGADGLRPGCRGQSPLPRRPHHVIGPLYAPPIREKRANEWGARLETRRPLAGNVLDEGTIARVGIALERS